MLRCPKCERFGVEYDGRWYKCVWVNCGYTNREYKEPKWKIKFKKFIKAIKIKTRI